MNGRIYDPELGRMISADPTIPHPHNPQSYNRYSYVMNNPLSRTDPTGFTDEANQNKQAVYDQIQTLGLMDRNVPTDLAASGLDTLPDFDLINTQMDSSINTLGLILKIPGVEDENTQKGVPSNAKVTGVTEGLFESSKEWSCGSGGAYCAADGTKFHQYSKVYAGTKVGHYHCLCSTPSGDGVSIELTANTSRVIVSLDGEPSYVVCGQEDIIRPNQFGTPQPTVNFNPFFVDQSNYQQFNHYSRQNSLGDTLNYILKDIP